MKDSLIPHAYTQSTNKLYDRAVSRFFHWVINLFLPRYNYPLDPEYKIMDPVVAIYIHYLYLHGRGRTEAQHVIHGLCSKLPINAKSLKWSQLSLAGWRRLDPPQQKCPMPWNITCVIAHSIMTDRSLKLTYLARLQTAVGLLVCWTALLRKGELCAIKAEHLHYVKNASTGRTRSPSLVVNIALKKTKTGDDRNAILDDEGVIALLNYLINILPDKSKPLFPIYSTVNYRIQHVVKSWNVDRCRLPDFTCHSLRHGAATHLHNIGLDMEYILMRGRWASTSSAKHYIRDGMAFMQQIDSEVREFGDLISSSSTSLFDHISQYQYF